MASVCPFFSSKRSKDLRIGSRAGNAAGRYRSTFQRSPTLLSTKAECSIPKDLSPWPTEDTNTNANRELPNVIRESTLTTLLVGSDLKSKWHASRSIFAESE